MFLFKIAPYLVYMCILDHIKPMLNHSLRLSIEYINQTPFRMFFRTSTYPRILKNNGYIRTKIISSPPVSMVLLCLCIHIIVPQSILHSWLLIVVANNIFLLAMLVGLLVVLYRMLLNGLCFVLRTPPSIHPILSALYTIEGFVL